MLLLLLLSTAFLLNTIVSLHFRTHSNFLFYSWIRSTSIIWTYTHSSHMRSNCSSLILMLSEHIWCCSCCPCAYSIIQSISSWHYSCSSFLKSLINCFKSILILRTMITYCSNTRIYLIISLLSRLFTLLSCYSTSSSTWSHSNVRSNLLKLIEYSISNFRWCSFCSSINSFIILCSWFSWIDFTKTTQ